MTSVVAGIIQQDRKILVCQRRADQAHPSKWEFPGGKVEAGESPEKALVRELEEELGINAEVGEELLRYEFSYPEKKRILLIFFEISAFENDLSNRIFHQVAWVEQSHLTSYDFLEGDGAFLEWFTERR